MTDPDFEDFLQARYAAMVRTAVLLTGSRTAGEDLLHEALIRTLATWGRVRERGAAEAYVRTTMVRLLIRDRKRGWSGEIPHDRLPEHATGEDPATAVTVRAALRQLPAEQRAAIVLRYYADQSETQIAEALNCAPGTVKSRISRGLQTLRESGLLTDEPLPSSIGGAT